MKKYSLHWMFAAVSPPCGAQQRNFDARTKPKPPRSPTHLHAGGEGGHIGVPRARPGLPHRRPVAPLTPKILDAVQGDLDKRSAS